MVDEISSDEVNYLVLRYLEESGLLLSSNVFSFSTMSFHSCGIFFLLVLVGFSHSAFTFALESGAGKMNIDPSVVEVGALISFLQKGLYYHAIEQHLHPDGTLGGSRCTASFSLLTPHICDAQSDDESHRVTPADSSDASSDEGAVGKPTKRPRHAHSPSRSSSNLSSSSAVVKTEAPSTAEAPALTAKERRDKCFHFANDTYASIPDSAAVSLSGHTESVFSCTWNNTGLLATGSGDSTARLWDTNAVPKPSCVVLQHPSVESSSVGNPVAVNNLEWSPDGKYLATGPSDGIGRIWAEGGQLKRLLKRHTSPIISLHWSPNGRRLLTCSMDCSSVVWNPHTGDVVQQVTNHTAPVLDVAWKDDNTFVSCGQDTSIFAYEVGRQQPIRHMTGHTGEINAVEWAPSGNLLASCSEDKTARIWKLSEDTSICTLTGHTAEIYSLQWSPACASYSPLLATASFDSHVKLWNPETGTAVNTLALHTFVFLCFSFSFSFFHFFCSSVSLSFPPPLFSS